MIKDDACQVSDGKYPSDCELTHGLRERAASREPAPERGYAWRACLAKAKAVRLLLLDVDGVLTDGSITYSAEGVEVKSFSTRDGMGIRLLREAGIECGLITARASEAVARRSREMALKYVYQGVTDKLVVYEGLCRELGLTAADVAYMGDDWLDLRLLGTVGFSATVADGAFEVRQRVDYVAKSAGGRGAVREVCELILEARAILPSLLARYL